MQGDERPTISQQQQQQRQQKHVKEEGADPSWFRQRNDMSGYNPSGVRTSSSVVHTPATFETTNKQTTTTTPPPNLVPNRYQNLLHKQYNENNNNDSNSSTISSSISSSSSSATNIMTKSSTGGSSGGGGGIFSSISSSIKNKPNKDSNNSSDGGGGSSSSSSSTRIPLHELFPTLYATNENQDKSSSTTKEKQQQRTITNKALQYNPNQYEAYESALQSIFEDSGNIKALARFQSKRDGKFNIYGSDDAELNTRIVNLVKDWLLSDERVIERNIVKKKWNRNSSGNNNNGNEEEIEKKGKNSGLEESKFTMELKVQQEIFLSKLLEQRQVVVDDGDNANATPSEMNENGPNDQQPLTVADINPQFFYTITHNIMSALGRYCARRARSSPMIVAWSKVKESGIVLPKDTISTFLYVCGTMNIMSDSIVGGGYGGGIVSSMSNDNKVTTTGDTNEKEDEDDDKNDKFLIPEEIATYHDLLCKPTESSISLRVKSLASKGDAADAEDLLETFKVSFV